MSPSMYPLRSERGVVLIVALLVLLALSLIGIVLMQSVNTETKLASTDVRSVSALTIAESGIAEAMARIGKADVPDTLNPRMTTQIFLAPNGSLPGLGVDSTALATTQPAASWFPYSKAVRDSDVLTITYKTNPARTQIYRYDRNANPVIQLSTGQPIFVISSVGRVGSSRSHIIAEVTRKVQPIMVKGAVTGNYNLNFTGPSLICGYNHRADTPWGTGDNSLLRTGAGQCDEALNMWEVGSGDLPGVWSTGNVTSTNGFWYGTPTNTAPTSAGFYAGPWEVFNMTPSEFWAWVGAPKSSVVLNPTGLNYLDNDGTHQNASGTFSYTNTSYGTGFLYVDGDLKTTNNFFFKGLVYVEGNAILTGTAWILGGLICNGKAGAPPDFSTGSLRLLYSGDAINQYIGLTTSKNLTLVSWREIN